MGVLKRKRPEDVTEEAVIITPGKSKSSQIVEFPKELIAKPNFDFDINRYLKSKNEDIIPKAVNLRKRYRENPFAFVEEWLGISCEEWEDDHPPKSWDGSFYPLWSKQREVLEALVKHRKVAVRSGHGLGKSFIAAVCVMYLSYVWRGLGVTTAPTFRQVEKVLWGEIHWLYNNAGGESKLGGVLKKTSLELGDKWFVEGFSTRDPKAAITGFHEENVFAIVDEAGGVAQEVFDAIEGILTSANSFILLIGNPIEAGGPFEFAFKPNSPFYPIHLSCWDCPNVRHKKIIYPKLVSHTWPQEKKDQWGEESNLYRVRVDGNFPVEGKDSLIPIKYIDLALQEKLDEDKIKSFGVDVARQGTDRTVIGVRYASGKFKILEITEKKRTTDTVGRVKNWYNMLVPIDLPNDMKPPINVDDIGVGGGVVDMLLEEDYPVNPISGAEGVDDIIVEEEEGLPSPDKFLNLRAWNYWKLRVALMKGQASFEDEDLADELSKITLVFNSKGKIKIPDKDDLRKVFNGASPDLADCMCLAWAKDVCEDLQNFVRFL
jgi:phage terminase large subunit